MKKYIKGEQITDINKIYDNEYIFYDGLLRKVIWLEMFTIAHVGVAIAQGMICKATFSGSDSVEYATESNNTARKQFNKLGYKFENDMFGGNFTFAADNGSIRFDVYNNTYSLVGDVMVGIEMHAAICKQVMELGWI